MPPEASTSESEPGRARRVANGQSKLDIHRGKPRVRFTVDGQRYSVSADTEKQTWQAEKKLRRELEQGRQGYGARRWTLAQFAEERYMPEQGRGKRPWSPATLKMYRRGLDNILPYLGRYRLKDLESDGGDLISDGLAAMHADMQKNLHSPRYDGVVTRNKTRTLLSRIFNYAVRLQSVTQVYANPVRFVETLEEKDPLSRRVEPSRELPAFLEWLRTSPEWHRQLLYTVVQTIDGCGGLRPGEALALKWGDFTLDRDGLPIVHVRRHFGGGSTEAVDGRKSHSLGTRKGQLRNPITPELLELLEGWKKTLLACRLKRGRKWLGPRDPTTPDSYVFYSFFGNLIGASTLATLMRRQADAFGLPRHETPHMQRHHWATEQIEAGESIPNVSEMLGHADPSITMRVYAASTAEGRRRAAERRSAQRLGYVRYSAVG